MIDFPIITTIRIQARKLKESFNNGHKFGYEEGIRKGMQLELQMTQGLSKEEELEIHKYLAERRLEFCYREITQGNDGYMQTGLVLRKIKQHPDKEHYVNMIVKNECEWNTKNQSM